MDLTIAAALFGGGLVAGTMNAVAGGSSFLTFPLLIASGLTPLVANTTNFLALTPANLMALVAYREELSRVKGRLPVPLLISAVGGIIGSVLLLWSGEARFARLVPWLILTSTVLFAFGTWIKARLKERGSLEGRGWHGVSMLCQFLLALYGGYFGAGMGIVLLACLLIFGYDDLHEANAAKNAFISIFSIIGGVLFVSGGLIAWPHCLLILSGTVIGGYAGVRFARRMPEAVLRYAVLAWAVVLTIYSFAKFG